MATTKETTMQKPDETRTVTLAEAKALPGLMGLIASKTLAVKGKYGYTDATTGRTILLVLR
jgi:hypothetical protein